MGDGLILSETLDVNNKVSQHLKRRAQQLFEKLQGRPARGLVDAGELVFNYKVADGVCYVGLFDKGYPKNLAFAFIEEIHVLFQEELKREFGTGSADHRSRIETIEKPYYFIKFDRQITKKRTEYQDASSSKTLRKVNENLKEVSSIMHQNIHEVLSRGENLEAVGRKAANLKFESHNFKDMARVLSLHTLFQKHAIALMIGLVFLIIVCFKVFRK